MFRGFTSELSEVSFQLQIMVIDDETFKLESEDLSS